MLRAEECQTKGGETRSKKKITWTVIRQTLLLFLKMCHDFIDLLQTQTRKKKYLLCIFFSTEIFNEVMVVYWSFDPYKHMKQKHETYLIYLASPAQACWRHSVALCASALSGFGGKKSVLLSHKVAWGRQKPH